MIGDGQRRGVAGFREEDVATALTSDPETRSLEHRGGFPAGEAGKPGHQAGTSTSIYLAGLDGQG